MTSLKLTAIYDREGDGYVALCPEIDVASQGDSIEEARANLREAVELYLEEAGDEEVHARLGQQVLIEPLEVQVG